MKRVSNLESFKKDNKWDELHISCNLFLIMIKLFYLRESTANSKILN